MTASCGNACGNATDTASVFITTSPLLRQLRIATSSKYFRMASLPPKQSAADLAGKSQLGRAGATVNRFAKRDPSLYPLVLIVGGIFATAGYMMMYKNSPTSDPARKLMSGSPVYGYEDSSNPSQVAAFKYRYKNRQGVWEDSYPILNQEIKKVASENLPKFRTVE